MPKPPCPGTQSLGSWARGLQPAACTGGPGAPQPCVHAHVTASECKGFQSTPTAAAGKIFSPATAPTATLSTAAAGHGGGGGGGGVGEGGGGG